MLEPLKILYLDEAHAGDRLFLDSLARTLKDVQRASSRLMIVHGGESQAFMRPFNKHLVAQLTDEVVSAVGIQGSDRRLLQINESGEVNVNGRGWLDTLIKQGVVPVISSVGTAESSPQVLPPDAVISALAGALSDLRPVVVVFTATNRPGVAATNAGAVKKESGVAAESGSEEEQGAPGDPAGEPAEHLPLDRIPNDAYAERDMLRRLADAGLEVILTNLPSLRDGELPEGTRISKQ